VDEKINSPYILNFRVLKHLFETPITKSAQHIYFSNQLYVYMKKYIYKCK